MSKKGANTSAPTNPPGQKNDHGILILVIVLVVLFTFVLPIAIVLLVVFGVVKPLIDTGIEYVNSSSNGNSVSLAYSRSIKTIYDAYKDETPLERDDCEIFEDFVEGEAGGHSADFCNGGTLTLAASQAGGRVEMVAFGEDDYYKILFNDDFTKYYELAKLTKLSEDPSGEIKQLEITTNAIIPQTVPDCTDSEGADCGTSGEGLDNNTNNADGIDTDGTNTDGAENVDIQIMRRNNRI